MKIKYYLGQPHDDLGTKYLRLEVHFDEHLLSN